MDGDRLILWIENDDLEQAPVEISPDDEHSIVALPDDAEGDAHRGTDVRVRDTVTTSAVCDVHP